VSQAGRAGVIVYEKAEGPIEQGPSILAEDVEGISRINVSG